MSALHLTGYIFLSISIVVSIVLFIKWMVDQSYVEPSKTETFIKSYVSGLELNKEQTELIKDGWMVDSVLIGGHYHSNMITNHNSGSCIIVTYKRTVK